MASTLDATTYAYQLKAAYLTPGDGTGITKLTPLTPLEKPEFTLAGYEKPHGLHAPRYPRVINTLRRPPLAHPHLQRVTFQRPFMMLAPEGGGVTPQQAFSQKYSCQTDARNRNAFAGISLAVTLSCWFSLIGGWFCTPVWAIISFTWMVAHNVICG